MSQIKNVILSILLIFFLLIISLIIFGIPTYKDVYYENDSQSNTFYIIKNDSIIITMLLEPHSQNTLNVYVIFDKKKQSKIIIKNVDVKLSDESNIKNLDCFLTTWLNENFESYEDNVTLERLYNIESFVLLKIFGIQDLETIYIHFDIEFVFGSEIQKFKNEYKIKRESNIVFERFGVH